MPITSDQTPTNGYAEKTGLTAGNEYVFMIPEDRRVMVAAKADTGAGAANLYFAMNNRGKTITDITDFDQQYNVDQSGSMSVFAGPGISHVSLKITSGTWRLRIKTIVTDEG